MQATHAVQEHAHSLACLLKELQDESKNKKVSVKEGFADIYFYILMIKA